MLRSIGRFSILLLIFISTIFLTCSKDSTGPKEQGILIKASDGGTITSPDGLLTLSIPAEALDNDTYINVEIVDETDYPNELDSINTLGEVYELQPDGITFNKAVFIEVETSTTDFENIVVDEKYPILSCIMLTSDGELSIIDSTTVEYNISDKSGKVSGKINHFCVITRTIDFFTSEDLIVVGVYEGQITVFADLGPDESYKGVTHSAKVEIINDTIHDLVIGLGNNSSNEIIDWPQPSQIYTYTVLNHSNKVIPLLTQWSCKDIGTGEISVKISSGHDFHELNTTLIFASKECLGYVDNGDEDSDGDGILDRDDNCPWTPNADQANGDGDRWGDACDNCPNDTNADQADSNGDGVGDACEENEPEEIANCTGVSHHMGYSVIIVCIKYSSAEGHTVDIALSGPSPGAASVTVVDGEACAEFTINSYGDYTWTAMLNPGGVQSEGSITVTSEEVPCTY